MLAEQKRKMIDMTKQKCTHVYEIAKGDTQETCKHCWLRKSTIELSGKTGQLKQIQNDVWEEFDLLWGIAPKGTLKSRKHEEIKSWINQNFISKQKLKEEIKKKYPIPSYVRTKDILAIIENI